MQVGNHLPAIPGNFARFVKCPAPHVMRLITNPGIITDANICHTNTSPAVFTADSSRWSPMGFCKMNQNDLQSGHNLPFSQSKKHLPGMFWRFYQNNRRLHKQLQRHSSNAPVAWEQVDVKLRQPHLNSLEKMNDFMKPNENSHTEMILHTKRPTVPQYRKAVSRYKSMSLLLSIPCMFVAVKVFVWFW